MFGLLHIMLLQFPGWKAPFSNTIGYLVVNASGIRSLLNDYILKANIKDMDISDNVATVNVAIQHIYNDPSLLINEVTPDTFDEFWRRMTPLFKVGAEEHKDRLRQLISLKDIVSEAIWYILTGGLISSICLNYISASNCGTSSDEMQKKHNDYEKQIDAKVTPKDKKVYITTD
jgi:hypothetical protein